MAATVAPVESVRSSLLSDPSLTVDTVPSCCPPDVLSLPSDVSFGTHSGYRSRSSSMTTLLPTGYSESATLQPENADPFFVGTINVTCAPASYVLVMSPSSRWYVSVKQTLCQTG